jgi:hypothetical protein
MTGLPRALSVGDSFRLSTCVSWAFPFDRATIARRPMHRRRG